MHNDLAKQIATQLYSLGVREQAALRNPNADIALRQIAVIAARRCILLSDVATKHGSELGLDEPTVAAIIAPKEEP